jgi:hypothetical protein
VEYGVFGAGDCPGAVATKDRRQSYLDIIGDYVDKSIAKGQFRPLRARKSIETPLVYEKVVS